MIASFEKSKNGNKNAISDVALQAVRGWIGNLWALVCWEHIVVLINLLEKVQQILRRSKK